MKKIFCGLLAVILCFGLYGCEETIPSTINETSESFIGFSAIPDESNLYYDVDTKIVYIIFKERKGYGGYGFMSPYYAPNGFPYQYDVNERTLIEIESSERRSVMNILDKLIWCGNQSVDVDGRMRCLAHIHEGRVPFCPYLDQADRLRSQYPCSDYEPPARWELGLT